MEKTNAHPHLIGAAAGLTAGVVYTLCATVIALWPTQTLNFLNNWFHGIDLTKIAVSTQFTFGKFAAGLIGVLVTFYVIGLIYGIFYNMCYSHCEKRGWI